MLRHLLAVIFVFSTFSAVNFAHAEKMVRFNSAGTTPTPFQIKRAKAKGIELKMIDGEEISGALRLPEGKAKSPALVMMHSCRGVLPYLHKWTEYLESFGVASLVVDSYSTRNIKDECNDHRSSDQTSDAYGALEYLTSLDEVDNSRIGLIGWGQSPVVGSMELNGVERFHKVKFRTAIGFYVNCYAFTEGKVYAPTLLIIAGKDDWSLKGRCAKSVAAGHKNGSPIFAVEYPDALHGFDDPDVGKQLNLEVRNVFKTPPMGATLGYSGPTHADAAQKLIQFLSEHLSIKLTPIK